MKRKGLRKCELQHVKLMPAAIMHDGASETSPDFSWVVGRMNADGLPVSIPTGHGVTLKDDHIHEHKSSSDGPGFLLLTVPIHISGDRVWTVPTGRRSGT
jgi:hypothetical protein